MIIDDDPINNFLSKLAIRETFPDTQVIEHENAVDALQMLNKNKNDASQLPWLILLDLNMPVMEGWMFLEEFSEIKNDLIATPKIFVLSASDYSEDIAKAEKSEVVTCYIIKPLTASKLKELSTSLNVK
jgi:CheY-like chemotaxis protein